MAYENQALKVTVAFAVGVIALLVALFIVFALWNVISAFLTALAPFLVGAVLILAAVVIVWVAVYFLMMLGVGIYYFITSPMTVDTASKGYSMKGVEESGKRQKEETKPPAKPRKARKPRKRKATPSKGS